MGLELLWRGRSHGSMFLAGGLCFLLIGHLGEVEPKLPLILRAPVGAAIITMVELGVGLVANRSYAVWDYRDQPGNLWGQICPLFTVLWIPVALLAMGLYAVLDKKLVRFWPQQKGPALRGECRFCQSIACSRSAIRSSGLSRPT